jgi:hypothetical protein
MIACALAPRIQYCIASEIPFLLLRAIGTIPSAAALMALYVRRAGLPAATITVRLVRGEMPVQLRATRKGSVQIVSALVLRLLLSRL